MHCGGYAGASRTRVKLDINRVYQIWAAWRICKLGVKTSDDEGVAAETEVELMLGIKGWR